jgi:tRNA(Ile)-lysidine synthase
MKVEKKSLLGAPPLFAKRGLYETFHKSLRHLQWDRKKTSVLLGLSGGRDSVALLHLLIVSGIKVTAAHLNHQLRGAESDLDEKFVKNLCNSWNVPLLIEKKNIQALAKKHSLSIEEAARIARYQFFSQAATKNKIKNVVVAHHQRDQAETVLLKIFFGCDRSHLRGMALERVMPDLIWPGEKSQKTRTTIKLSRPFLQAPYSEINLYIKQNKLLFREDRSNQDSSHPRNWIRNYLLPEIEKRLNRNVVKTLARFAQ